MDFATLVRSRLAKLGRAQKDLAQAAQVADSYVSQLLTRKRVPPAPDRTDIYPRMEAFLRLEPGALARLAETERTEELKHRLGRTPEPLFQGLRDLILDKCVARRRDEVRAVFERQPFGTLERLITQKLLDVAQRIARRELDRESCVAFVDPLLESWDVDLDSLRVDITLNRELVVDPRRRFEFVETDPFDDGEPPGLAEFLADTRLSGDITDEETRILKLSRPGARRATKLYYHRALQNLRDPLHFREG